MMTKTRAWALDAETAPVAPLPVQYVPFDKRAWHAGVSQYQGRERCNDFSIGIELEGTDTLAYTDAQYQQLAAAASLQNLARKP